MGTFSYAVTATSTDGQSSTSSISYTVTEPSQTGQGQNGPTLTVTPAQAKYGDVTLGSSASQTFTVSNGGDAPLQIEAVILIAGSPEVFPISNDGCSGQQVAPGFSCQVTVGFAPIATGDKDGSLLLITNASNPGVSTFGLSGTGIDSAPTATFPPGATGPPGAAGPAGATGPRGRRGPSGKSVSSIVRCVFRTAESGKRKTTHETCTARVPAPHSQSVKVAISRGQRTYATGTASVHRGVARLHLHIRRAIRHARYVVTVTATNGKHATVTHYTTEL